MADIKEDEDEIIKPRVLIVEDEGLMATDLKKRIQSLGYTVTGTAATGPEAVKAAASSSPDIVLMDIMLKGDMDGVEAAEIIGRRFDLPVIFLTAYTDPETLERAKITEPYGYIIKPFEERELTTSIEIALYKHRMEKKLRQSEAWLSKTLMSIGDAVIATDKDCRIVFMNPVAVLLTGWSEHEAHGRPIKEVFNIVSRDVAKIVELQTKRVLDEGLTIALPTDTTLIARDGNNIRVAVSIDDSSAPIIDDQGDIIGMVVVFRDCSAERKAKAEREGLIKELREALANVKALKGLIPICSSCKKIRDDQGCWNQLEAYISEHSDADFTHGLCPHCLTDFKNYT